MIVNVLSLQILSDIHYVFNHNTLFKFEHRSTLEVAQVDHIQTDIRTFSYYLHCVRVVEVYLQECLREETSRRARAWTSRNSCRNSKSSSWNPRSGQKGQKTSYQSELPWEVAPKPRAWAYRRNRERFHDTWQELAQRICDEYTKTHPLLSRVMGNSCRDCKCVHQGTSFGSGAWTNYPLEKNCSAACSAHVPSPNLPRCSRSLIIRSLLHVIITQQAFG